MSPSPGSYWDSNYSRAPRAIGVPPRRPPRRGAARLRGAEALSCGITDMGPRPRRGFMPQFYDLGTEINRRLRASRRIFARQSIFAHRLLNPALLNQSAPTMQMDQPRRADEGH